MAKLTPYSEKQIFQQKIEDYLKKSTEDYSRFFDGRSTFVTYYAKNSVASYHESTLDSAIEMIGSHSPIKYNRIENFVLYQFPNLDLDIVEDEMGMMTEIDGEAVVPPDMKIEPLVDDYFILEGLPENYLFRVVKVNFDKISGQTFYKIEFSLEFYEKENIEKQVSEEYIANYDTPNLLLTKENHVLIELLDSYYNSLLDLLNENFLYEPMNYFFYTHLGKKCYDPLWTKFVIQKDLLRRPNHKDILNSIFLSEVNLGKSTIIVNSMKSYSGSIYEIFDKPERISKLNKFTMNVIGNTNRGNELGFEGEDNFIMFPAESGSIEVFPSDFKDRIESNTIYNNGEECTLEDFVILSFNNKINKDNLENYLECMDFTGDIKSFVVMPYILDFINRIKKTII